MRTIFSWLRLIFCSKMRRGRSLWATSFYGKFEDFTKLNVILYLLGSMFCPQSKFGFFYFHIRIFNTGIITNNPKTECKQWNPITKILQYDTSKYSCPSADQNKQESTQDFPFLNHENTASINLKTAFPNSFKNLKVVQVIKRVTHTLWFVKSFNLKLWWCLSAWSAWGKSSQPRSSQYPAS